MITPAMSRASRRVSSLTRWTSDSAAELPTFQSSSTRLSDVFTCWPPGPEERENRQPSSEAGIVSAGDTSRSMHQALHTVGEGGVSFPAGDIRGPAVPPGPQEHVSGVGFALVDEGVNMSYKYRTVRVRGTDLVGTIARKHGSAPDIYETSKDPSTSVVPVFFEATGEIRFFDRSMLEDVVAPAS